MGKGVSRVEYRTCLFCLRLLSNSAPNQISQSVNQLISSKLLELVSFLINSELELLENFTVFHVQFLLYIEEDKKISVQANFISVLYILRFQDHNPAAGVHDHWHAGPT